MENATTVNRLNNIDTLSARLAQAQAVLSSLSAGMQEGLSHEIVVDTIWATTALLEQAQDSLRGLACERFHQNSMVA